MMNIKSVFLSSDSPFMPVVSLSLSTVLRLSHTPVRSNFAPRSRLPSFTPFTIMPAISLTALLGYSFTMRSIACTHESASPLFRRVKPSRKINLSLFSPKGKRSADSSLLWYTSRALSSLKASYVAP